VNERNSFGFQRKQLPECLSVAVLADISQACFLQGEKCSIILPIISRVTFAFFPNGKMVVHPSSCYLPVSIPNSWDSQK